MVSTVFLYSLFRLYKDYCINDLNKLIVICQWILLKSECVIHNEPVMYRLNQFSILFYHLGKRNHYLEYGTGQTNAY